MRRLLVTILCLLLLNTSSVQAAPTYRNMCRRLLGKAQILVPSCCKRAQRHRRHPLSHAQSIAVGFYNPDVFCYANTSLQLLTHSSRWMNTIAPLQSIQPTDTSITTPLFNVLSQIKDPKYNALQHTWWPSVINPSHFTTALVTRSNGNVNQQSDIALALENFHYYLKKDYPANQPGSTITQNLIKITVLELPQHAFSISNLCKKQLGTGPQTPCMFFKLWRKTTDPITKEYSINLTPLIIEKSIKLNNTTYELTGIALKAYDEDGGGHVTALVKDIQLDPETGTWANNLPVWHFINDSSVSSPARSKHIFEDIEAHGMHDTHGYPYMLLYQVTEPAMVT